MKTKLTLTLLAVLVLLGVGIASAEKADPYEFFFWSGGPPGGVSPVVYAQCASAFRWEASQIDSGQMSMIYLRVKDANTNRTLADAWAGDFDTASGIMWPVPGTGKNVYTTVLVYNATFAVRGFHADIPCYNDSVPWPEG